MVVSQFVVWTLCQASVITKVHLITKAACRSKSAVWGHCFRAALGCAGGGCGGDGDRGVVMEGNSSRMTSAGARPSSARASFSLPWNPLVWTSAWKLARFWLGWTRTVTLRIALAYVRASWDGSMPRARASAILLSSRSAGVSEDELDRRSEKKKVLLSWAGVAWVCQLVIGCQFVVVEVVSSELVLVDVVGSELVLVDVVGSKLVLVDVVGARIVLVEVVKAKLVLVLVILTDCVLFLVVSTGQYINSYLFVF